MQIQRPGIALKFVQKGGLQHEPSTHDPAREGASTPWIRGAMYGLKDRLRCKYKMTACADPECTKHPCYGVPGKRATRCATHKLADMINVVSKRCTNCTKTASFDFPGQRATRCAAHKLANMINVVAMRCSDPECMKIPSFGIPGERATRCANHKLSDMVNVRNLRLSDVYNSGRCASCNLGLVQRQGDVCALCIWDNNS